MVPSAISSVAVPAGPTRPGLPPGVSTSRYPGSLAVPAPAVGAQVTNRRWLELDDALIVLYLLLPLRTMVWIGHARGWVEYALRRRARAVVRDNLRELLGSGATRDHIEALTRRFFTGHQIRTVLRTLGPVLQARGELGRIMDLDGLDRLERSLAIGRGVILLGSHINSAGMLLVLMELRRRGVDARVALPAGESPWAATALRAWLLSRCGSATPTEATGAFHTQFNVRPLVAALRSGAALLLLGDGSHSASFTDVNFCGHRLPFTSGPLGVARLTGVPVVPVFATGTPGRFRIVFEEPFVVTDVPGSDSIASSAQHYATLLERHFRADPSRWQHLEVPGLVEFMRSWRDRSLRERYHV